MVSKRCEVSGSKVCSQHIEKSQKKGLKNKARHVFFNLSRVLLIAGDLALCGYSLLESKDWLAMKGKHIEDEDIGTGVWKVEAGPSDPNRAFNCKNFQRKGTNLPNSVVWE